MRRGHPLQGQGGQHADLGAGMLWTAHMARGLHGTALQRGLLPPATLQDAGLLSAA